MALFQQARAGALRLMASSFLLEKFSGAPEALLSDLTRLGNRCVRNVVLGDEARGLAALYLEHGILVAASANDALHLALATTEAADVVASWNFKHIVHIEKVRAFGAVNLR